MNVITKEKVIDAEGKHDLDKDYIAEFGTNVNTMVPMNKFEAVGLNKVQYE